MKKEISSVKTGKKISEKLLCVLLIHLTELQLSSQKSHSLRLLLWNLQSDIWKPIEGYGEEEIILR